MRVVLGIVAVLLLVFIAAVLNICRESDEREARWLQEHPPDDDGDGCRRGGDGV